MSDDQSEEKTDEASDKKLRELRDKGVLPSSSVGSDYAGLAAGIAMTLLLGPMMVERLKAGFDTALTRPGASDLSSSGEALEHFLIDTNSPIVAVMLVVAVAGVFFKILANGGFVFAMARVEPKLENVSPMSGIKRLFKGEALVSFTAGFVRFLIILGVMAGLGYVWGPTLLNLDTCVPGCAPQVVTSVIRAVLITCAVLIVISMAFDVGVQKAFFLIEQRMTKTEVKRERKDMMGTPEIKQERKRLMREMAESANVVGRRNATIYFFDGPNVVAFAFDPVRVPLPKVAARARGEAEAMRLREELDSRGIPGVHNPGIVEASIGQALGSSAKREIFLDLATALRQVLG